MDDLDAQLLAEEKRLARETALAVPVGSMSGVPLWEREARDLGDASDFGPALSALPPLPARTVAAFQRLYRGHAFDPRASREGFRGTIQAMLGGAPLHPAVIQATSGEFSDPEGGFAVQPDEAKGVFSRAAEQSLWMRLGVRVETMTSSERLILALDDDDETSDAEAGLVAQRLPETVTGSVQNMKIRRMHLKAEKLMVLAAASNELSEDSPDFLIALEAALIRAIAKKFDRMTLTGLTGSEGILGGPATITVQTEGGQAVDTINWFNVLKMWARMSPGSHENSVWLTHPTTLPQLLTMSLPIGVAGERPRGVFETGGPTGYQMLTRPVYISSRVKPLGDKGDLILVDPSQVVVGIRRGLTVQRSEHALFTSDAIAVRARFRGCSGQLWDTARTMVEGSGTVSPYVVLQAR